MLGYTQNQFLTEAGGTIDSVSIANLNRNTVRNNLNTYANNLIDHIKRSNAGWALSDVVGGKEIQQLVGSPIRQLILPNLSPYQPPGFPQNWGISSQMRFLPKKAVSDGFMKENHCI